ncbi:hypothetical protein Syun_028282 [Stephania yunnanensis]|uniref:Uncharacterized protein n=1 Tax=Stephania yunnanensis TaxID=152371 RepID=A0AAP0EH31_9MAGN
MNVPAVDGGLLKPDVVEGTDDEVPYFVFCRLRVSEVGLVGTEGIVEASELGGGYGGFGASGLGNAIRFESILCKTSVDSTAYIASLITILTELSEALMSSPDENGDFVKLESSLSLKGKNAAMVLCWLLGNGCLFAWNVMFLTLSAMYELLCVLLYAYVFGKLPIVKYYRAKAASEERTDCNDLVFGGIQRTCKSGGWVEYLRSGGAEAGERESVAAVGERKEATGRELARETWGCRPAVEKEERELTERRSKELRQLSRELTELQQGVCGRCWRFGRVR